MEEGGRKFNVNKATRRYMATGCGVALVAVMVLAYLSAPENVYGLVIQILFIFVAGCGGTELVHGGFNALEHKAKAKQTP